MKFSEYPQKQLETGDEILIRNSTGVYRTPFPDISSGLKKAIHYPKKTKGIVGASAIMISFDDWGEIPEDLEEGIIIVKNTLISTGSNGKSGTISLNATGSTNKLEDIPVTAGSKLLFNVINFDMFTRDDLTYNTFSTYMAYDNSQIIPGDYILSAEGLLLYR